MQKVTVLTDGRNRIQAILDGRGEELNWELADYDDYCSCGVCGELILMETAVETVGGDLICADKH